MFVGIGSGLVGGGVQASIQSLLFGLGEPGVMFDPTDITTLYQDRAGTTPVTDAGQSVGLRLDKSQGLRQGPELVTNGGFDTDTAWNKGTGWTISDGKAVFTSGGTQYANIYQAFDTVAGTAYLVKYTLDAISAATTSIKIYNGSGIAGTVISSDNFVASPKSGSIVFFATSSLTTIGLQANASLQNIQFDNISVRELAGNHEVAVSDAKRGVYGWMPKTGKRNLLDATDTLSTQSVTVTAVAHTLAFTGTGTVTLSGVSTAGPLVGTGAGNRVSLTFTPTAGSLTLTVSGSVTLAQLEVGSTATAYQRVASQYDITEAGVPTCYYVQADGVDDAYVTPTITPNTDKVQVFAGVRKLSEAGVGTFVEFSTAGDANNGAFYLRAPWEGVASYDWLSGGTINSRVGSSGQTAPITNVITGLGDISGDTATLRINGTQVAQSTSDQGTGNYLAYPAYIYGRGGTSLPFNGLDFGHAVRFGPNLDAATITRVESLIARNTPEVDFLFGGVWNDGYAWNDNTNWNDGA